MKTKIFLSCAISLYFSNIAFSGEEWKYRTQDFKKNEFTEWKEDNLNLHSGLYEYEYGDSYGTIIIRAYLGGLENKDLVAFVCLIEPSENLSEPAVKVFKNLTLDGSFLRDEKKEVVFSFVKLKVNGNVTNCVRFSDMIFGSK